MRNSSSAVPASGGHSWARADQAVGEIHTVGNESENATTQSDGEVLLMSVVAASVVAADSVGSLIVVVVWQLGRDRKKIDLTCPNNYACFCRACERPVLHGDQPEIPAAPRGKITSQPKQST